MTIPSKRLILVWMLRLTASSAIGMTPNITDVMTGNVTGNSTESQMTTQKAFSPFLQVSDRNFPQSTTADANPIVETSTWSTLLSSRQTAAATTISISYHISTVNTKSTTDIQMEGRTTATVETASASNPTTGTMFPLMPSNFTQNTEKILTFQPTNDEKPQTSTHPAQSTHPISTTTTSTNPTDSLKSTSPVPGQNTKTNKGQDLQGTNENSNEAKIHSKVVTGLIVGALTMMMLGFLVIFIKKQRLQKKQKTTTEWAGPSPFLEDAAENGIVARRSSNTITLAGFLPQGLSKRLSLLPETDEELNDMTAGTTFGQEVQISEENGTAVGIPENKSTEDASETDENSVSVTPSKNEQLKSPQVTT